MNKDAEPKEILLLTGNNGKLKEIKKWLDPLGFELKLLDRDFIEAQVDSLEEVIQIGMRLIADPESMEVPFIKDDSGLFIEALDGFPGVYSAYVYKTVANEGILKLMDGVENRKAFFRTVIGLYIPGHGISLFSGECKGTISNEIRGKQGFGYDPIFIPDGQNRSFAEMSLEEKNSMSHRIKALERLTKYIVKEKDLF